MDVQIVNDHGIMKFRIGDSSLYSTLSFRSFRPDAKNISDFYGAGVRLMNVLTTGMDCSMGIPYSHYGETWTGDGIYDFFSFDGQMELFMGNAPEAKFLIMIMLDSRDWWQQDRPDFPGTYWTLGQSEADEGWRRSAAHYLKSFITYIEEKYNDRVFAYAMVSGGSNEWFTFDKGKPHPIKEAAYRQYTGDPKRQIPDLDALAESDPFLDPVKDKEIIDYLLFHGRLNADTILYFASEAQRALNHKKPLGLFFGYLLENTGTAAGGKFSKWGHVGYERVYASPDLDMIFAPAGYGPPRTYEGASSYQLPADSVALHQKLYFHEVDHRTSIAPRMIEGRSVVRDNLGSLFEDAAVLRREFMKAREKGFGLWWFDFFGGYYDHPALMAEVATMTAIARRLDSEPAAPVSQTAVFADAESVLYLREDCGLWQDLMRNQRDSLSRMGAPYDLFSLGDIIDPAMDHDRYRMYVFLNAFKIDAPVREFIEMRLKGCAKTLVWVYAPNYVTEAGLDPCGISDITDMNIRVMKSGISTVDPVSNPMIDWSRAGVGAFGFSQAAPVTFAVDDPRAIVLGRYAGTAEAGLAIRDCGGHRSVYCGVGGVPPGVWRELARLSGVHIYFDGDDPIYANSRWIGIHPVINGQYTLHLGRDCEVEELFDGGIFRTHGGDLTVEFEKGKTKMFLYR